MKETTTAVWRAEHPQAEEEGTGKRRRAAPSPAGLWPPGCLSLGTSLRFLWWKVAQQMDASGKSISLCAFVIE